MDEALHLLAGHGHASGEFTKLDNVFDVIYRNSHEVYSGNPDEGQELFFEILMNREMTLTIPCFPFEKMMRKKEHLQAEYLKFKS